MIKVIFECSENMNNYKDEQEFEDDATDEFINEAWIDWVWEQCGEHYNWYRK